MKKVLAIYYTQTGQLKNILDSTLSPILKDNEFDVDYLQLTPVMEYPFPWGDKFFQYFSESVNGIPCKMTPYNIDADKNYDLIVVAHQPWFLSPSIPIWSFLSSSEAATLLKGKKVITIIGARNMWVGAQEIIKRKFSEIGADLVGNIALQDRHDNIIAGFTIIRWLIHGRKGASKLLPEAGVSEKDIKNAAVFGEIINNYIKQDKLEHVQNELLNNKAVKVKYHLLNMEITARKIFCKFARLAAKKGKSGIRQKERIILLFKYYVIFALFIISPIASLVFMITRIIIFPVANKKMKYYSDIKLKN